MSSKSFWDEVREVATGKFLHDHLTAQLIGEMCCVIVDIAKERRHIPKGRVRKFEDRGQSLKEQGIKETARFSGADFVLGSGASIFEQVGMSIDPMPFEVLRPIMRLAYEKKRTSLAKEFVALSDELLDLSRRRSGRPRGKGAFDTQDYEIMLKAMKRMHRRLIDSGDWPAAIKEAEAALRSGIAEAGYPGRGGPDKSSDRVHMQRIKRKIRNALEQREMHRKAE